ncbi:MAG TPA: hypothetical protein VGK92_01805 [Gaiellales bacterium]|jgi:hypothetical protein
MSSTSDMTRWAAYRAWSRSLPVQIATIPLVALSGMHITHSALGGLAFGVAATIVLAIRLQLSEWRRRRREHREHIARLGEY